MKLHYLELIFIVLALSLSLVRLCVSLDLDVCDLFLCVHKVHGNSFPALPFSVCVIICS